jgi:hypothetical protein
MRDAERQEGSSTTQVRDNRAMLTRWRRMACKAEALDNVLRPRLSPILLPLLHYCGTVAEWLWRHV